MSNTDEAAFVNLPDDGRLIPRTEVKRRRTSASDRPATPWAFALYIRIVDHGFNLRRAIENEEKTEIKSNN